VNDGETKLIAAGRDGAPGDEADGTLPAADEDGPDAELLAVVGPRLLTELASSFGSLRPGSPPPISFGRLSPSSARRALVDGLADELDLLCAVIGVFALGFDEQAAIGLGLGFGACIPRGETGLDAFGHELSASSTRAATISSSGTTRTIFPLMKRWPRRRPAAMPRSASRASPGPFTTHPMTATWMGSWRDSRASWAARATPITSIFGPTARRAGDEVDGLALTKAHSLEKLASPL